jgi:hypothetical protein
MEIAEARALAKRGWWFQVGRCGMVAAAFCFCLALWTVRGMPLRWEFFCIWALIGLYIAQWTWREWKQRQFLMSLRAPLQRARLLTLRAEERLHTAVGTALIFLLSMSLGLWMLRNSHFATRSSVGLMLLIAAVGMARRVRLATRELRQAQA